MRNQNERILSVKATDAEESLADSFACFVGELEWVDGSMTIEDIEDYWTDKALAEVVTADMSEDEASQLYGKSKQSCQTLIL